MPETFDVDHAFEALAHDVMHHAAPPSAINAITQARRRRRRTALAAVAAAVAIIGAGVAVPTLIGDDHPPRVADHDGLRPLPEMDVFSLDGWALPDRPHKPAISNCASVWLDKSAGHQPESYGHTHLVRKGGDRLLTEFADFGAGAEDEAVAYSPAPPSDCGVPTATVRYDGGEVQHFTGTESGPADLWVARQGPRVALAVLQSDVPATPAERTLIADQLMAALVVPGLWDNLDTDPVWTAASLAFLREINHAAIDQAFGSWFTGWYADAYYEGGDRCRREELAYDLSAGRDPGTGVSIRISQWETGAEATSARETLLAGCESEQFTVVKTGATTWIATAASATQWVAQSGAFLAELSTQDGAEGSVAPSNPPAQTVSDVTALLTRALDQAQQQAVNN